MLAAGFCWSEALLQAFLMAVSGSTPETICYSTDTIFKP